MKLKFTELTIGKGNWAEIFLIQGEETEAQVASLRLYNQ